MEVPWAERTTPRYFFLLSIGFRRLNFRSFRPVQRFESHWLKSIMKRSSFTVGTAMVAHLQLGFGSYSEEDWCYSASGYIC